MRAKVDILPSTSPVRVVFRSMSYWKIINSPQWLCFVSVILRRIWVLVQKFQRWPLESSWIMKIEYSSLAKPEKSRTRRCRKLKLHRKKKFFCSPKKMKNAKVQLTYTFSFTPWIDILVRFINLHNSQPWENWNFTTRAQALWTSTSHLSSCSIAVCFFIIIIIFLALLDESEPNTQKHTEMWERKSLHRARSTITRQPTDRPNDRLSSSPCLPWIIIINDDWRWHKNIRNHSRLRGWAPGVSGGGKIEDLFRLIMEKTKTETFDTSQYWSFSPAATPLSMRLKKDKWRISVFESARIPFFSTRISIKPRTLFLVFFLSRLSLASAHLSAIHANNLFVLCCVFDVTMRREKEKNENEWIEQPARRRQRLRIIWGRMNDDDTANRWKKQQRRRKKWENSCNSFFSPDLTDSALQPLFFLLFIQYFSSSLCFNFFTVTIMMLCVPRQCCCVWEKNHGCWVRAKKWKMWVLI